MSRTLIALVLLLIVALSAEAKPKCGIPQRLTRGLTLAAVLEKPVRPVLFRGRVARNFLRNVQALQDRYCWPSMTFEEKAAWIIDASSDPDNLPQSKRLKALLAYMRINLSNLQVAYFGNDPEWDVIIFGRDKCGHITGFRITEVT